MSTFGRFLRKTEGGYLAWCPGCDCSHYIPVELPPHANGPQWSFNGDKESPTFAPSILIRSGSAVDPSFKDEPDDPPTVCHSFIRKGQWQFCGDSTHEYAGQTVLLPEYWWEVEK